MTRRFALAALLATAVGCGGRTGLLFFGESDDTGGDDGGDGGDAGRDGQATGGDAAIPRDASISDVVARDAIAPGIVTCNDPPGLQAGSPWPIAHRCPARQANTTALGPVASPPVAWQAQGEWSPDVVIGADGTLYGFDQLRGVVAMSPDGGVLWTAQITTPDGGSAFVSSVSLALGADGTLYAWSGTLAAFTPAGSLAWSTDLTDYPGPYGPAIGGDGTIYVAGAVTTAKDTFAGNLTAVSPAGTVLWQTSFGVLGEPASSPSVGADGALYIIQSAPGQQVLDAFTAGGAVAWSAPLGPIGTSGVVVVEDDGTIATPCGAGLCTFDPAGKPLLTVGLTEPAAAIVVSPVDGLVFAGQFGMAAVDPDGGIAWNTENAFPVLADGRGTLYAFPPGNDANDGLAVSSTGETDFIVSAGRPVAMGASGAIYGISTDGLTLTATGP